MTKLKLDRVLGVSVLVATLGAHAAWAAGPAAAGLERLKSLAGRWEGTTADGKAATLELELIAGGTVVMERFAMDGLGHEKPSQSMYTMYHLDEEDLMLVHYCVSNNQPQMRANLSADEPDVLRFEFVGSTNMPDPDAGHMYKAMIRFVDDRHITTEWSYRQNSKEAYSIPVTYERVQRSGESQEAP